MRTRETRKKELDAQKQELLDTLSTTTKTKEEEFSKTSKAFVKTYVTSSLDYSYNPEELAELDEQIAKHNEEVNKFSAQENDYEEAKSSMWSHLKANGQSLLKGNIKETLKTMKDEFVKDYKEMQENKDEMDSSRSEIDKATSDEIMQIVVERYIYISFVEKSNIVYLENDYIEEEEMINGLQQLFQELPGESINCGIMEVEEKRKYLDTLRNKEGREIIRREFIDG